jgi:hypothetical protein
MGFVMQLELEEEELRRIEVLKQLAAQVCFVCLLFLAKLRSHYRGYFLFFKGTVLGGNASCYV